MKKVDRRKKGPSRASLREMPEVDFKAAKVRRNPFAKRIAAEGIVHGQQEKPKVTASRHKDFAKALRRVMKTHDAVFRKLAKS